MGSRVLFTRHGLLELLSQVHQAGEVKQRIVGVGSSAKTMWIGVQNGDAQAGKL